MLKNEAETKARLRSLLWDVVHKNRWSDEDDFSLRLTDKIYDHAISSPLTKQALGRLVFAARTSFFTVNSLSKAQFVDVVFDNLSRHIQEIVAKVSIPLGLSDIFPEVDAVGESEIAKKLAKLDVEERYVQNSLRRIFRAKGGSPIPDRTRDTAQEVADVEYFRMPVRGRRVAFAVIVKGYRSIRSKTLTWDAISHQVTKAYRGKPDHIIVASAKDPADGLLTSLQEYANSVSKPHLITFIPPRDLARVLIANGCL